VAFLRLGFPRCASSALSQRRNFHIVVRQSASIPTRDKFFAVNFNPRIYQQLLVFWQLSERQFV
jgi:hypothetical protein